MATIGTIQEISEAELHALIASYEQAAALGDDSRHGLYYCYSQGEQCYTACDNSHGECYIEDFDSLYAAVAYLQGMDIEQCNVAPVPVQIHCKKDTIHGYRVALRFPAIEKISEAQMDLLTGTGNPIGCFVASLDNGRIAACENGFTGSQYEEFGTMEEAYAFLLAYAPETGLQEILDNPCIRSTYHNKDGGGYEYALTLSCQYDEFYTVSEHSQPGSHWNMHKQRMACPEDAMETFRSIAWREIALIGRALDEENFALNPYPLDFHVGDERVTLMVDTTGEAPCFHVFQSDAQIRSSADLDSALLDFDVASTHLFQMYEADYQDAHESDWER